MRTLKKTLCLVLCLVMMAGLCVFGASAEFTDEDKIENKEAAAVLTGIGVLTGRDDGSFDPTATLTRAEACAIIARLLGNETYMAQKNTPFDDVPASNFYSGYIAFCYSKGIVAGTGKNLFKPNEKLTAAAWAKMLLCALGYNADAEGLVGNTWDLNTAVLVSRTKLADGMSFDPTAEMTRDGASLLAFNALTVSFVEYDGLVKVTTSDNTVVEVGANRYTTGDFLCDNFGMSAGPMGNKAEEKRGFKAGDSVVTGVITANSFNSLDAETTTVGTKDLAIETGADLFGHYVRAYVDEKGTVLSLTDIGSTKKVGEAIKADDEKALKANFGAKYADGASVTKFGDYVISKDTEKFTAGAKVGTYVFDDTGALVAEILESYVKVSADVVKDTKDNKINLKSGAALDNNPEKVDEVVEYDGIAADDVVIVKKAGEVTTLVKAESVTGVITKKSAKNDLTLDGTAYAASGIQVNSDPSTTTAAALDAAALKQAAKFTLYLDENGKYFAIASAEEVKSEIPAVYYFQGITVSDTMKDNKVVYAIYATLIDAEGVKTTDTILASFTDVNDRDNGKAGFNQYNGKFITLKANSKTGCMDVTVWEPFAATKEVNLGSGTATAAQIGTLDGKTNKIGTYYVNGETKFVFIADNGKVEVKTGLINLKNSTAVADAKLLYTVDKNNNSVVKTAYISKAFSAGEENAPADLSAVFYITAGAKATTEAGYYTYSVYDVLKGEKKEIKVKEQLGTTGGFYSYTTDKDGYANSAYIVEGDANAKITVKYDEAYGGRYENSIRLKGAEGTDIDAATAIIVDTRDKGTIASLDDLAKATDVTFDVIYAKAGVIAAIFVK